MNNNIRKLTKSFIKKYKLTSIDYGTLKKAVISMGYTVIEFNSLCNEKDEDIVIRNLHLSEKVLKSRGFTYTSAEYRLVFINEDLSDEEKLLVMSHEVGHIVCKHFSSAPIIGNDVKEEYEANEFSHYLLCLNSFRRLKNTIVIHRKAFIAFVVVFCLIIGIFASHMVMQNKNTYKDSFYITSSGKCYHKKECIFVKNKTNIKKLSKKEYEHGIYSPCSICLPEEN